VKARRSAGGRRQEDYNPILKPDLVLLGVGIRQQIQVSGIIYLGLEGNIITGKGEERSQLRLITGYSLSF
jgi:hypothetical protein